MFIKKLAKPSFSERMEALAAALKPPDTGLPPCYWGSLSQEDKTEFIKLRTRLHQNQKSSLKDRRLVSFSNEMLAILGFLERTESCREQRSILAGISFAGPFICVNTRQLKSFLGRCKSSINGSLQQLGYIAVRTKSKARACVLSVMPSLANERSLLRQWTVRGASDEARFCFISRFQPETLPTIAPEDLNEERKPPAYVQPERRSIIQHVVPTPQQQTTLTNVLRSMVSFAQQVRQMPNQLGKKRLYNYDLSSFMESRVPTKFPEMKPSYSMENVTDMDDPFMDGISVEWNLEMEKTMIRSHSLFVTHGSDWEFSVDDDPLFSNY
jgi:hypothetical protein